MIHYFAARRCPGPEEMADETIWRALRQIGVGAEIPDLTRYCYGIAAKVRLESRRKRNEVPLATTFAAPGSGSIGRLSFHERFLLLRECLGMLSAREQELLREYYLEDRKQLAVRLQVTSNALRLRVFHALEQLRERMSTRISR
jgi:DNA-directed RNA polymerase specialized sigma24 family protein